MTLDEIQELDAAARAFVTTLLDTADVIIRGAEAIGLHDFARAMRVFVDAHIETPISVMSYVLVQMLLAMHGADLHSVAAHDNTVRTAIGELDRAIAPLDDSLN